MLLTQLQQDTKGNINGYFSVTDAPHIITNDPSTEESEGYMQFLQTYGIELNNIMNPNTENTDNTDNSSSLAKEVDETLVQDNPSLNIKMNDKVDLHPHYVHRLWTQLMHLAGINIIDASSSQTITQQEDHDEFFAIVTALGRPQKRS